MAQAAELSDPHTRRFNNSSFDSEFQQKSRTVSSSSSTMGSEEISTANSQTSSQSSKSSTSSRSSSCNEAGEEVWNNFIFKPIQPEDHARVLAHMRESFYRDEPLNAITGYSEEKAKDMDLMILSYLKDDLSSIVLERETNKIAGARIIAVHRRQDPHSPLRLESKEMKKIMPFLDIVDEKAGIFDRFPEIDKYAELFMASVHPKFRGQGLAGQMYRGAVALLKARGFKVMKSCFTSPFTKKIGDKMGFKELSRAKFNEYAGEDGKLVFPGAKDDELAVIGVLEI